MNKCHNQTQEKRPDTGIVSKVGHSDRRFLPQYFYEEQPASNTTSNRGRFEKPQSRDPHTLNSFTPWSPCSPPTKQVMTNSWSRGIELSRITHPTESRSGSRPLPFSDPEPRTEPEARIYPLNPHRALRLLLIKLLPPHPSP